MAMSPAEIRAEGRRLVAEMEAGATEPCAVYHADSLALFVKNHADVLLADPEPWVTYDEDGNRYRVDVAPWSPATRSWTVRRATLTLTEGDDRG